MWGEGGMGGVQVPAWPWKRERQDTWLALARDPTEE